VLAVDRARLAEFEAICARERCPYAVVGEAPRRAAAPDRRALRRHPHRHAHAAAVRQAAEDAARREPAAGPRDAARQRGCIDLAEAVRRVLRLPTVADKTFLITIGDRSVTGLVARDQMVGPWQVPVADCAVTLTDYDGTPARPWPSASARRWRCWMPRPRGAWRWPRPSPTSPPRPSRGSATSSCPPTGWPPPVIPARTRGSTTPCARWAWSCARRSASRSRWARTP
jgi:hypothetical protein